MRRSISRRLPRLSRRAKVLRNLALAAALILAFCLGTGRSAWTSQGALRRMETGLLLHPGPSLLPFLPEQERKAPAGSARSQFRTVAFYYSSLP